MFEQLSNQASGMPDVAFKQKTLNFVAKRLLEPVSCCCCLPTPMTLASEGSPMFPLVVHQPAYLASSAVTPAGSVHKSRGDNVVRMWVQLKR